MDALLELLISPTVVAVVVIAATAGFLLLLQRTAVEGTDDPVLLTNEEIYGTDDYLFKAVLAGDCAVGKSQLLRVFAGQAETCRWAEAAVPTAGVDFRIVNGVRTGADGKTAKVQLWDVSGDRRFDNITRSYTRGGYAPIMVFDLGSRASFDSLQSRWLADHFVGLPAGAVGLLVGGKADLASAAVPGLAEEARKLADARGWDFVELSAKARPEAARDAFVRFVIRLRRAYDGRAAGTVRGDSSCDARRAGGECGGGNSGSGGGGGPKSLFEVPGTAA